MSAAQHTPTPWAIHADPRKSSKMPLIGTSEAVPYVVASVCGGIGKGAREANAAFIVRACNSHAALLAALELYGEHKHNCFVGHYNPSTGGPHDCDCGLDAALKAAKGEA